MAKFVADDQIGVIRGRGLNVFVCSDFLSPEACLQLIGTFETGRLSSNLWVHGVDPCDFAGSKTDSYVQGCEIVASTACRIDALLGMEAHFGEPLEGQRWEPGQQSRPQFDWFDVNSDDWHAQRTSGGQRTWSVLVNLNQPERGGGLLFVHGGIRLKPLAGTLIAWSNCEADGRENVMSMHVREPVSAGRWYLLKKRYREHPFVGARSVVAP